MVLEPVRRLDHDRLAGDSQPILTHEWLVTNGLGGYACGTVCGASSRRYHGFLVAAFPAPLARRLVLSHLGERVRLPDGKLIKLSSEEQDPPDRELPCLDYLREFRLEMGLPIWRYELPGGVVIERQVVVPHEQNTVHVIYRLLDGADSVRLKLLPTVHHRSHDEPVSQPLPGLFRLTECYARYELAAGDLPPLRMMIYGQRQAFTIERQELPERLYQVEESRGYEARGTLWSPGYFRVDLTAEQPAALVASAEPWEEITALEPAAALAAELERRKRRLAAAPPAARNGFAAELVLSADQFIIKPVGRTADAVRVHAEGDEVRTVIAGYHWFTDWGRDTMISLEGLTLSTGRHAEAGYILRMFGYFVRDGLLPNLFPEGENEGLYHTADATLWFFHAIDRYLAATDDRATLEILLPRLIDVAEHHVRGTRFGIGVDPDDGLLRQGAEGYQLTWMDAKVGDWVVTPRRGKAVEINALWYNALCLLGEWLRGQERNVAADEWQARADQARESFNERFWNEQAGYLYDVVDGEHGDDDACRPNQLFAISLKHPVLAEEHWPAVVDVVRERLLTPVGLRSLAPGHKDYQPQYYGDIHARDAAYHQGTVWGWLIGPFVDAWLKVHPDDRTAARQFLTGFDEHLSQACLGSISEIFDAEEPYTPRGCVAQAWSVAEVLRCWLKTEAQT